MTLDKGEYLFWRTKVLRTQKTEERSGNHKCRTVERAGDAWPREERTEARYLALRILLM